MLRAANGVPESRDGLVVLPLLQVRDSERVESIRGARIDPHSLLEQIRCLRELLIEQQRAALEEILAAFQE